MSSTYKVRQGDDFVRVARIVYGDDEQAKRIADANPGVAEPLVVGSTLYIPTIPGAPQTPPSGAPFVQGNEVAVLIDGLRFRFWDSITITRTFDSVDVVSFGAPMEVDAPGFRQTFVPFSYKPIAVTVGGATLFTGTMLNTTPNITPERKTLQVDCYGLPGVLGDANIPASAFPTNEFNNLTLTEIATELCKPFGIVVEVAADVGTVFERVSIKPDQTIFNFIAKLAKERNIVVSSSPAGALVLGNAIETGVPVARFFQGQPPLQKVTPNFDPQSYFSSITGLEMIIPGLPGSQFTVKNEFLAPVVRPFNFKVTDTKQGAVKAAVESKAGRMFGNAIAYELTLSTWRDEAGNLWAPNTLVTVTYPDAFIYSEYTFVVRSVVLDKTGNSETAKLSLMLPGSFNGKIPEALPWTE